MEMHTTEGLPIPDRRPLTKAWLVWEEVVGGEAAKAFAGLKQKAADQGADAIVGVRLIVSASDGYLRWVAYGTALRHSGV
jgi:uncharacterized protein YbjQ (UPF0145 family)